MDSKKKQELDALMTKLRSRSSHLKSWADSIKAVRMAISVSCLPCILVILDIDRNGAQVSAMPILRKLYILTETENCLMILFSSSVKS